MGNTVYNVHYSVSILFCMCTVRYTLLIMSSYPPLLRLCLLLNNPRHYPTLYPLPTLHTLILYPYVTKCRSRLPTRTFGLDLNSTKCKTHIPFIPAVRLPDAARVLSGVIPFPHDLTSFVASHNAKQTHSPMPVLHRPFLPYSLRKYSH